MSKFKVGDEIVGNERSIRTYSITKKGNGYGIVRKILSNREILIEWKKRRINANSNRPRTYEVNPDFFELKQQVGDVNFNWQSYME